MQLPQVELLQRLREGTGDELSFPALGGRLITCEEIAELALFLVAPLSSCINGQVIYANEGNTIVIPSGNIY